MDKDIEIVVVDDPDPRRRCIGDHLAQLGFANVIEAENAEDALSEMRARCPALIVVDWSAAPLNGLQLLQAVRQDLRLKAVPFIMVTSESDSDDAVLARISGSDTYIAKPFGLELLMAKMTAVLSPGFLPFPLAGS